MGRSPGEAGGSVGIGFGGVGAWGLVAVRVCGLGAGEGINLAYQELQDLDGIVDVDFIIVIQFGCCLNKLFVRLIDQMTQAMMMYGVSVLPAMAVRSSAVSVP